MLYDANIANERRLVARLKNYWDNIREDEGVPNIGKFNINSVQDIWGNCMLFDISSGGTKKVYQCSHVGDLLVEGFGKDLKNRYVSSYDKRLMPGSNLLEFMDESVNKKDFILSQGQFVNHKDKIVKYRNCILPFVNSAGTIRHLVIGLSWRAF